jgi:hypothetical protein
MFPYPVQQCQPSRGADRAGSDSVRAALDPVDRGTVDVALDHLHLLISQYAGEYYREMVNQLVG